MDTVQACRLLRRLILCTIVCVLLACAESTEPIKRSIGNGGALSAGLCPINQCNSMHRNAVPVRGVSAASQPLSEKQIDHLWSSPIAAGALDYQYASGETVYWVPQVDRVMKLRLRNNTLEKITELALEPESYPRFSPADMQGKVAALDKAKLGSFAHNELAAVWGAYQIEGLRAANAMLSSQGVLYVGNKKAIVAYADAEPGDPDSAITQIGQFVFDKYKLQLGPKMPVIVMIGMSMLADGHIVAVTIDGTVMAIKPDFSAAVYHRLAGEQVWQDLTVDDFGHVYVAGNKNLHKLVWTGKMFSDKPQDGAWRVAYARGTLDKKQRAERGSGTGPSLMGANGDKDKFVVMTDAADVNNLLFFWRDAIPKDWQRLPGASSLRLAGSLPINFGDTTLDNVYSENALTVFDYGVVLANKQTATAEALTLDAQLKMRDPERVPYGLQKFQWNASKRAMEVAWIRKDVSSANSLPVVAMNNRQLHTLGIKGGRWVLQTLDWDSGANRAAYALGASVRFNPAMSALQLLANGDPVYAGFAGIMHLRLSAP